MATQLDASDAAALLAAAELHDGSPALSEHKLVRLQTGRASVVEGRYDNDDLIALIIAVRHDHADGGSHWAVEAALSPLHRDSETERAVLASAAGLVPPGAPHTVWAWRDGQTAALRSLGYQPIRRILRLERSLPVHETAGGDPAIDITPIVVGVDEPAMLAVNNRAFVGHPEDGNLTLAGLAERMERPWFDAAGLLLARRGSNVIGFCWTKLHPEHLGEIYAIAVDPRAQNRGIGRALLIAGLADLHGRRHARRAVLWVESDNRAARRLYARMGFRAGLVNMEFAVADAQPKR